MKVIQDTPLTKMADDKLGRENIVDLIVDSINNHVQNDYPCLVYGIYGKWGEGKTSLLNFVEEKLLAQGGDDNINIIKFNPWLVNNDETLLREFFKSMTRRLDDKTREIFEKYGSLAILASKTVVNAFLPGIGYALAEGI
jgi:predicted KAP-like P-loop ATPase